MAIGFGVLNSGGGEIADSAYLGWDNYTWDLHVFADRSRDVFDGLSYEETILEAVLGADYDYPDILDPEYDVSHQIFGDKNTTLHSVYSGTIQ